MKAVAQQCGITVAELRSAGRTDRLSKPRHEAMWKLKWERKLSTPNIGRLLGGRDHTTVMYGLKAHRERLFIGDDPLGFWPCLFIDKRSET